MGMKNSDNFYAGVCSALALVSAHGEETILHEIVSSVGKEELVKHAQKEDGIMEWSGLSRYGYGEEL